MGSAEQIPPAPSHTTAAGLTVRENRQGGAGKEGKKATGKETQRRRIHQ